MKNLFWTVYALAMTALACGVQYVDVEIPVDADTRFVYWPDPELDEPTREALSTLTRATGVQFSRAAYGTPVVALPPEAFETGSCAQTRIAYDDKTLEIFWVVIEVAHPQPEGCMANVARTILHEALHNVRRYVNFRDPNQGHTKTGVFQEVANDLDCKLNEESLIALCEGMDCNDFKPEE